MCNFIATETIFMKKIYSLLFGLILIQNLNAGTIYWVGTTGNYSAGSNWNTQADGSGTAGVPLNSDDVVISKNATITIDGTYLPSSLWITNDAVVNFINNSTSKTYTIGGSVNVSPQFKIVSGCTLNISGTGAIIMNMLLGSTAEIYGTLDILGSSSRMNYTSGEGITRIKNGGIIRYGPTSSNGTGTTANFFMEAGSTYEIYKNGGTFPTGTYDPNSLILNTGAVANPASFSMNSSVGSYGNYEFNSPSCNNTTSGFSGNDYTVNNFTLTDDGSGAWVFSTNTTTAYTFTINGNLTQATGTVIDINRGASGSQATKILIKRNVTSAGTITETNGNTGSVIELAGSGIHTLSLGPTTLSNDVSLIINKNGNIVLLSDLNLPASSNAKLTFTNGYLDGIPNNKIVSVQNPSVNAVISGTVLSHVIGSMNRSTNSTGIYTFPVSNNSTQLAKAEITPATTTAASFTVTFLTPNPNNASGFIPGVIEQVTNYYWDIARTGTTDVSALKLYYSNLSAPGIAIAAQAKIIQRIGSNWVNLGGNASAGGITNTLGSTGAASPADPITSFTSFAIGGVLGTLPVSIEYFNGIKYNAENKLSWKINCTNSSGVTMFIERSKDGRNFNTIQTLQADQLRCAQPFFATDVVPTAGKNFYRIAITDADGRKLNSRTIVLLNKQEGFEIVNISPNPAVGNSNISINSTHSDNEKVQVIVLDMHGRKISEHSFKAIAGMNQFYIPVKNLPTGSYQVVMITENGERKTTQFIK